MEYNERKKLKSAVLVDGREVNNPVPAVVVPDIMKPPTLEEQLRRMTVSDRMLMRRAIKEMDRDDKQDLLEMYDEPDQKISPYQFYDLLLKDQIYEHFDREKPAKEEPVAEPPEPPAEEPPPPAE